MIMIDKTRDRWLPRPRPRHKRAIVDRYQGPHHQVYILPPRDKRESLSSGTLSQTIKEIDWPKHQKLLGYHRAPRPPLIHLIV